MIKTHKLILVVIVVSIVIFVFSKRLCDPILPSVISIILSLGITIGIASELLKLAFRSARKEMIETSLFQEKYEETSNILQRLKKELEEKEIMLQKRTETLTTFNRINRAIISTVDLDRILFLILDSLQKYMNFDRGIIFLNNHMIEPIKGVGINDEELKLLYLSIEDKTNLIVKTILEAKPKIVTSIEDDCLPANFIKLYNDIKPGLLAAVPLISKEKVIGLLLIDNLVSKNSIQEKDVRNIAIFTNQAGLAIDNARLFEVEKKFADELERQIEIAKKELEQAQVQLIKSERLSALGEMAAVVAHEVRNPMASIQAAANRINKKLSDEDINKKYIGYILEETERLNRVVKNILVFSREFIPQLIPTNINELMENVLFFLNPEIKVARTQVIKLFEPSIPTVSVDSALIRQVLVNIIQNALFFIIDSERKELKIATLQSNGNVIIEISDTGRGIPKENFGKIFEPFFTTKPTGTGLGLTICNRIIESHKGKIEVESRLNHGTTFRIILSL